MSKKVCDFKDQKVTKTLIFYNKDLHADWIPRQAGDDSPYLMSFSGKRQRDPRIQENKKPSCADVVRWILGSSPRMTEEKNVLAMTGRDGRIFMDLSRTKGCF